MNNNINYYKYDGVQALRFLAAAMVLVTHSFFYASERLGGNVLSWVTGAKGVDIFFIISGFVMVISSRNLISQGDGWRTFLQHRLIRIVPLYWTATSAKLLIVILMSGLALHSKFDLWVVMKSYFFCAITKC